jgi:four helix bundle protein
LDFGFSFTSVFISLNVKASESILLPFHSTFLCFRRNSMTEKEFKNRTKKLALRIVRVVQALPKDDVARTMGKQLLRSGTSVAANYRAACRGKSTADVMHKLSIVEEEADESLFWMVNARRGRNHSRNATQRIDEGNG